MNCCSVFCFILFIQCQRYNNQGRLLLQGSTWTPLLICMWNRHLKTQIQPLSDASPTASASPRSKPLASTSPSAMALPSLPISHRGCSREGEGCRGDAQEHRSSAFSRTSRQRLGLVPRSPTHSYATAQCNELFIARCSSPALKTELWISSQPVLRCLSPLRLRAVQTFIY